MARNIEKIAAGLGAKVVGQVPDTGGSAFGATRLARIVETMQARSVEPAAEEAKLRQQRQARDAGEHRQE